jgi:hypothetical protein
MQILLDLIQGEPVFIGRRRTPRPFPEDHPMPNGNMNASQIVALFEDAGRHPKALGYELARCAMVELVTLAYQQYAPQPLNSDVPDELASMAYDEMERRQTAKSRLLADNPTLAMRLSV